MKFHILLFIIIILTKQGYSQEKTVFTLKDCINRAIAENLDLKIQKNYERQAMLSRQQSQWQLAPSVSGWGSSSLNLNRSTDQNNDIISGRAYSIGYGLSAGISLFSGFTKLNTIAAMKYNELVYNESTRYAENQLYLQIIEKYSTVLYQRSMIDVLDEKLQNSIRERDRIKATIETGRLEKVALYEIEATVSGNQLSKKQMENSYKLALIQLAQLIEWPNPETFEISDEEFKRTTPQDMLYTYENIYNMACINLPEVKRKEYQIQYLKKILSTVKGRKLPSISLNAGYRSNYYSTDTLANGKTTPFIDQYNSYRTSGLGLSLSIPVFNGFSRNIEVRKSKISLENGLYALENQKKLISKEIVEAIQRLKALKTEFESAKDNLMFVEKSYDTYREKFQLGLISSTDFITAQNQLSQAQANVISARYSWIIQQKIIELYKGERKF